jgi:uncharacterized protein (DUF2235 family)
MRTSDDSAHVPRQIVICCDGTNNTLTAGTEDTNVLRLYAHLAQHPSPARLLYYDPGVGTLDVAPPTDPADWLHRSVSRLAALASGRGVYDNIEAAYRFVMTHWRDERDRIYAFGFSRGAFTARCVVGMINLFGVLAPEHDALLPTLVRVYFSQPGDRAGNAVQQATRALHRATVQRHARRVAGMAPSPRGADVSTDAAAPRVPRLRLPDHVTREMLAAQIRELFTTPAGRQAWVHWVGVWDTVESVGLPGPLSRSNPATATIRGKRMRHVRHALALDEHRWSFEPRLYEEPGDIDDPATGQTLRQRWFHGVHCDVGGGYPVAQAGLSDAALHWMVDEVAPDLGVPPLPPLPPAPAVRVRHDALWSTPWWALAGMSVRDRQPRTARGEPIEVIVADAAVTPQRSVWAVRRPLWPVLVALLLGAFALLLSGACLGGGGWPALFEPTGALRALQATREFALAQLEAAVFQGLLAAGREPWWHVGQPAWAMAWDGGFIAAWGYLLARIASRGFAWAVGAQAPGQPRPRWRWLAMAPLLAVGGDALEDVMTWLALGCHAAGSDLAAHLCLWLGALGSIAKFAGLLGCLPWLALRVWIALPGVRRWR